MLKALYTILLFFISFGLNQMELVLEREYNYSCDYIKTDQLNNLYLINKSEIKKLDKNGQITRFSNNLFGDISILDISDPFKILIYNKDFNKIQYLDHTLAPISDLIFLDELAYYNVQSICQSVKGGFWIFDKNLAQIFYIDQDIKTKQKSVQLSELVDVNEEYNEVFMLEKNDYIYLGIEKQGVLLFDSYGTYIKTFPLIDISSFQVIGKNIIYFAENELILYHTETFNKEKLDLPAQDIKDARIEGNTIYTQGQNKISVFRVNHFK